MTPQEIAHLNPADLIYKLAMYYRQFPNRTLDTPMIYTMMRITTDLLYRSMYQTDKPAKSHFSTN